MVIFRASYCGENLYQARKWLHSDAVANPPDGQFSILSPWFEDRDAVSQKSRPRTGHLRSMSGT